MKPVLLALLLLPMPNALFAQTKINKAFAEQLIQMERDWSQADVKKDAAALNRILAEDWIGIDFQGIVLTKAEVLSQVNLHSDATATESTELGEMKIRIFGNTALVSGTEIEKSEYKGKDSSGKYIWTDVFVRRNGRWQAVSSQSTKLAAPAGPMLFARRRTTSEEGRSQACIAEVRNTTGILVTPTRSPARTCLD
jgi:ketosteroid isomerase-like protein